ncbi:MAG TPA: hypothetical protein VEV15_11500 [Flavisolibacter sp.]|nr:hypothetical protein [Flavisolibacter sp.]
MKSLQTLKSAIKKGSPHGKPSVIFSTKHHRLTAGQVYDDGYVQMISTLSRKNKIPFPPAKNIFTILNVASPYLNTVF